MGVGLIFYNDVKVLFAASALGSGCSCPQERVVDGVLSGIGTPFRVCVADVPMSGGGSLMRRMMGRFLS